MVPDRLWYTVQTVLLGAVQKCSFSYAGPASCQAELQLLSGELQAGGNSICVVWLECSYDPPEGQPGHLAYTFVIYILSTSLTAVSFFSV